MVEQVRAASATVWIASKWLRFIFQLPLMSGLRAEVRSGIGCSSQRLEAGQVALLEQLERRSPAGRHVVDLARRARTAASAAALSPPPTTVKARVSAIASATVRVPAAKRGSSNTPIGPFQNTVRASAITSVNSAAEPGPMSRPIHPSGISTPSWRTSPPADGIADLAARARAR